MLTEYLPTTDKKKFLSNPRTEHFTEGIIAEHASIYTEVSTQQPGILKCNMVALASAYPAGGRKDFSILKDATEVSNSFVNPLTLTEFSTLRRFLYSSVTTHECGTHFASKFGHCYCRSLVFVSKKHISVCAIPVYQ